MLDVSDRRRMVREVVQEIVGRGINDAELIVSCGLIDSLSVLRLISMLETRLHVVIPPHNLQPEDFDSVEVILGTLEREVRA